MTRTLLLAAAVLVGGACGDEAAEPVRARAFDELFTIRQDLPLQDDPDAPLGLPIALTRWGGNFVLVDQMLGNVKVFDYEGRLLLTIGRRGEGPGEFRRPVDAAELQDGSLAVLDYGNGRVSIFDPAGELVAEWPTPPGRFHSMDTHEGRILLGGYLIDEATAPAPRAVHILTSDGRLERSLRPRSRDWRYGERTFASVRVTTAGSILCSFETVSNRAHFVDLASGLEWSASVGDEVYRPVDWSVPEERARSMAAATEWYDGQMWVNRVVAIDGDLVLVRFSSVAPESGERFFTYVLADHDGSTRAITRTATRNSISYADEDGLFGFHVDDMGRSWVRRYTLDPHLRPEPG